MESLNEQPASRQVCGCALNCQRQSCTPCSRARPCEGSWPANQHDRHLPPLPSVCPAPGGRRGTNPPAPPAAEAEEGGEGEGAAGEQPDQAPPPDAAVQLQLALGAGAGGAAALAQPPAGPGTAGQQGDQGQALQGGSPADRAWRDSGGFSRTGSRGHGGGRAPLGSRLGPAALATLARGPRTPARPGGSSDDASPSDFAGYRTDAVPGHRGGPGDLSAQ